MLLLTLAVGACGSPAPTQAPGSGSAAPPSQPPQASSAASPPSSPVAAVCEETATEAPAATSDASDPNAATYVEIEQQVQELRGLQATTPVARGVLDQAGLCAYLRTTFRRENPEELQRTTETLYKQLLLIPGDASLEQLTLDLWTSQFIGLYDDTTRHMYVITKDGSIGPAEEITYAHEYTHALQDQRFGIRAFRGEALDQGDRGLARISLLEGDAYLLMSLWAQRHLTQAELVEVAGTTDPAAQAALESLPAILKEPLLSLYTLGLNVALGAYASGGYSAVDALYANPPNSTEQLLHADKLASHEAPVPVVFPDDLATRVGAGWKVSMQDTVGELQLGIILKEGGATAPLDAAAGWGGDRVALLEGPDGKVAVVLDTAWDTTADADEFATALAATEAKLNAAGRSARVLRPSASRVVLVSAESADTMALVERALGVAAG